MDDTTGIMNFKFKNRKNVIIAIAVIAAAAVVIFIIFFGSLTEGKRIKIFSDSVDIQVKDVLDIDVSGSGLKR